MTELACQKIFLDIFDNLVSNNINANLLSDNNFVNGNINIDTKIKSNLDENMTAKHNKDFCENDSVTNIEELFQHVNDQIAYKRLIKIVLEQICRLF